MRRFVLGCRLGLAVLTLVMLGGAASWMGGSGEASGGAQTMIVLHSDLASEGVFANSFDAQAAQDFTEIPVVINILKNSNVTEADAKAAVQKASEILKQANIKLTVLKVNTLAVNDGDDGSGGGTAGDAELTREERNKVREAGGKEIATTDDKKGIKITFAKVPTPDNATNPGVSVHRDPTIIVKDRLDPQKTGETIAHEIGHVLTLAEKYAIGDTTDSNDAGHAPDIAGKNGKENLMAPSNYRTGTNLTEKQKEKIKNDKQLDKVGKAVEKSTPAIPGEKKKQQHGGTTDSILENPVESYLDLYRLAMSSVVGGSDINTLLTVGGLFPDSGTVSATYRLLLDIDANQTTGIAYAGFLGIDREVRLEVQGTPLSVSGATVNPPLTGTPIALPSQPLLVAANQVLDVDAPAVQTEHQLIFDIPKAQMGFTAQDVPVGLVSESASEVKDTASLVFDQNAFEGYPTLALAQGAATPGKPVSYQISGLAPNSSFSFFIDEQLLFTKVLGPDGGFTDSFIFPSGKSQGYYFLTAQDSSGEVAFNVIYSSVGGIIEPPDLASLPLETTEPGRNYTPYVAGAAAAGVLFVVLTFAGWYARRRWLR